MHGPESEAVTGMEDLVTWYRAQLDEDERVAREAIAEHDGEASWPIERNPGEKPRLLWLAVIDSTSPETMPPAMAEHISRGDPKHRLAEVDAKRRILNDTLAELRDDETNQTAQWRVKVLALPYADRPGYREEWRP